jgi:Putative Ig domain
MTKYLTPLLGRPFLSLRAAFFALVAATLAGAAPLGASGGTPPSFTSAATVTFPQGIEALFTITTVGSPTPAITQSGKLPGGIKFVDNGDGTATLSGRPGNGLGQTGNYLLTLTASNGVSPAATQNFTLTITRPPAITSVNNATFIVGTPSTFTFATRNSVPKATLSYTGTLPAGVSFVPNNNGTATLSGMPASGSEGVYPITITAVNGTLPNATQNFKLTVQDTAPTPQAPAITSPVSTTFTVNIEGTFTVRTTGTPTASLSATGTLPSWLSFIDNTDGTATLVGNPDPGGPASYTFTITASNGVSPDANQAFTLNVVSPPPVITSANNATFVAGTFNTFSVRTMPSLPPATLSFTGALPVGVAFVNNSNGTATLSGTPSAGSEGVYQIAITAANGVLPNATQTFTLTVQDTAPVAQAPAITSAASTTFTIGSGGNFSITTTGTPTSGVTLTGPRPIWLSFIDNNDGTATLSGTPDLNSDASYPFTITAINGVLPAATQNFTLFVPQASAGTKLINISTRLLIMTGDNIAIGGFIITGPDSKKLLIRGIGPSLTQFGVPNALQDPTLELHDGTGSIITSNDDWKDTQQTLIEATGLAPSDNRESAILITLQPGSYTVLEAGKNGTTGIGLAEVYDLDTAANAKLINISTRGLVQTGDNVMIGGFALGASGEPGSVVIRAIGPSLIPFGVANALADPTLALYDGNGMLIASNDNWKDTQQTAVQNTGLQPPNDLESAIFAMLPVANYTAIVQGKNGSSGVALVEVYSVP